MSIIHKAIFPSLQGNQSFLAWFLDKYLVIFFPRSNQYANLTPKTEIETLGIERNSFLAHNSAPYFELEFKRLSNESGWFYLEATVVRHTGNRTARLIFEYADGNQEFLEVPSTLRGIIREVVYIPKVVSAIFWQPSVSAGWFSQTEFVVHKITALEAFYRKLWRVFFDYWPKRAILSGLDGAPSGLFNMVLNLDKYYRWSAELRINKSIKFDYDTFTKKSREQSKKEIALIQVKLAATKEQPKFSVLMPVYNPPIKYFRAAIESLLNQLYPNWELCIADDASHDHEIELVIEEYKSKDSRVKAYYRRENGHISEASNTALEMAEGQYVVLLDQDDLLAPDALLRVAALVLDDPNAALIYSDEDKINAYGVRYEPYFKPDWNEDLFYSQNFVSHLGVYKTELVRKVGGFRKGYEGSQDYDLALRIIKNIQPNQIKHIPHVLYHWRAHFNSTANNPNAKNYAHEAGIKALSDHFSDTSITVESAWQGSAGMYRLKRALPEKLPLVSLIIATRDQVALLKKCVKSILDKTSYPNYELIIVDNQSIEIETHHYLEKIQEYANVKVIQYDAAFNFSAINNTAAKYASGEILGLINNDIEVISDCWLSEMVSNIVREDVGVVGAKLLYSDNTIQHAGVILGIGGMADHAHKFLSMNDHGYFGRASLQQEFSAVTAACMLVKKALYFEVGMLDDKNLTVAFNDVDFCLKVRLAGKKVVYTPYALLYHHESISRGQENTRAKQKRQSAEIDFMRKKWNKTLKNDLFYNPNLPKDSASFI